VKKKVGRGGVCGWRDGMREVWVSRIGGAGSGVGDEREEKRVGARGGEVSIEVERTG